MGGYLTRSRPVVGQKLDQRLIEPTTPLFLAYPKRFEEVVLSIRGPKHRFSNGPHEKCPNCGERIFSIQNEQAI